METTIVKFNVKALKAEIKRLSEYQIYLKNQRKTVKLVGVRFIFPSEATWKHRVGREHLRIMFAAYGIMRGKTFDHTEKNNRPEGHYHPLICFQPLIDKVLASYLIKEVVVKEVEIIE